MLKVQQKVENGKEFNKEILEAVKAKFNSVAGIKFWYFQ